MQFDYSTLYQTTKILDWSKFKAFTEKQKLNATEILKFVLGWVENTVGRGQNDGNQHFFLFSQCFLSFLKQISIFGLHLYSRLQMNSIWSSPKLCRLVQRTE